MGEHQVPVVIQGGMGVNVSSWQLARAVSRRGQLGVVSGTALDAVLARGLQDGDQDGHLRRALAAFPDQEMAQRAVDRYLVVGGRAPDVPYRPNPTLTMSQSRGAVELAVLGNFVHVWLAKEGHDGIVGINFLEKVQMATPSAALGARGAAPADGSRRPLPRPPRSDRPSPGTGREVSRPPVANRWSVRAGRPPSAGAPLPAGADPGRALQPLRSRRWPGG